MKRRAFLKLSGMSAATALLAGCRSRNEKLIPYLVPPDEGITPGRANYYASACRSCAAGCGILVRVSEGRAKKIEGNPSHPVNRGKLCARGQALVQELYHPDRIVTPLKRSGARGSGNFTKISWDEAMRILTAQLKGVQVRGRDRLALVTPPFNGSLAELTAEFMKGMGSPHHVTFDLQSPEWLAAAYRENYGSAALPYYDLSETRYVLSFGADFLEHHLSPVHYGYAFGQMRQGRDTVRGHFAYVGGRLSLTAASADRWVPARPGTEGAVALAMARVILQEKLHDEGSLSANGIQAGSLLKGLAKYDVPRVAEFAGIQPQTIVELAKDFATTTPALAMVGEKVAFQSNGRASFRAVHLLNVLVGGLNRKGGIYPAAGPSTSATGGYAGLATLVERMRAGQIEAALIHGNPFHSIPVATGFQEALAKVPFVASFSSILNDSAMAADLILPDSSTLESWGDVVPVSGTREPVVGLMQPVVAPLHDTRQFGDVLLATAAALNGQAGAGQQKTYLDYLKGSLKKRGAADSPAQWNELLRQGVLLGKRGGESAQYRWSGGGGTPDVEPPRFVGDQKQFPLFLETYPSIKTNGGAALPWLQQLPDTMTTVVWDSWVEINPKTAAQLGIAIGDLVEVASPQGSVRLPAIIYPGIRPDLVAIPLGQGQFAGGRYAKGVGVNPLVLLQAAAEAGATHPAWQATRVSVRRISPEGNLVMHGHPQGSYRSELVGV
ncbi:molybdopterin-dependent oxidoreductase [Geomonas sp. RF6]|uniref:molybdopterin-containing oxidoreductase family protein n=1 Tax=Geomonas sp. RF6 TaxID=2897342 RepID=UPI001E284D1C|nr:molybdopterin-dependent oxidoreductase [Geomonas sp. RF6]UFS70398.1 molybdopterin-dependent oxidoreductase [Geomonas sp. RF6]